MGEAISHSLQLGTTGLTKHLVTWAAQTWDGHKMQAQQNLRFCGVPKNLNLSILDLGSACNTGTASDSSQQVNLEPEQCRLRKHTHRERGQTQCGWITHNMNEQVSLKKVTTTTPIVLGQKLDTEETNKQKKLK